MRFATALSFAAVAIGSVVAQNSTILGFNCGASDDKGKAKVQADFEREFRTAQNLEGAPGRFNAFRLYSNIQWGTEDTPIEAFAAAISTNTRLLLGIWASGTNNIDKELDALTKAIEEHGTRLTDLVVGLSIGSEDLYRVTQVGIRNKSGPGNGPAALVRFIRAARERLASTPLRGVRITHVDTADAWANASSKPVIDEVDFVSMNAFPLYESELPNSIDDAAELMSLGIGRVVAAAQGKEVWLTETGWAYTGPDFGAAKATVDNARRFWREVGCALFGRMNVFWYTLRDANPENKVKFAITQDLSTTPRFDLSCPQRNTTLPPVSDETRNRSAAVANSTSATGGSNSSGAASSVSVHGMTAAISAVFAMAVWFM